MTERLSRRGRLWPRIAIALSLLVAVDGCILFPRHYDYRSSLVSAISQKQLETDLGAYEVDESGRVSFRLEGLRIDVRPLTDGELNRRYPDESSQGEHSTNPYTYGDWVDPSLGHTPARFVCFEISVHNYTYAKVELSPTEAVLKTDKGELFHAYGVSALSSPYGNSFERYYRSRRGQSGNEYYRFDYRMGVVRSTYFGPDEPIFKGDNYSGLIAFDVPRQEAEKVRLVLVDFVSKFDSFGRPLETMDIPFDFYRQIEVAERIQDRQQVETATTEVMTEGPRSITGNLPGDATRSAAAVNAMVRSRLSEVNGCFSQWFDAGEAVAGEVVIEFTIAPSGLVGRSEVVEASVANDEVGPCVAERVAAWRFRAAGEGLAGSASPVGDGTTGAEIDDGGGDRSSRQGAVAASQALQRVASTQEVTVVYPFLFRAADQAE